MLSLLSNIIIQYENVLASIRIDIDGIDIPWPFAELDLQLVKVKSTLQKILKAFIQHIDEMEHLLQYLTQKYQELKLTIHDLSHFELKLPKIHNLNGWANMVKDIKAKYEKLQQLLYDQMHTKLDRLLSVEWPKMYKHMFKIPTIKVGGWIMKLKIFIGFVQCFCYFPVIFDIPWPKNVLDFMEFMEFDFMVFFGDISCRMQLGKFIVLIIC